MAACLMLLLHAALVPMAAAAGGTAALGDAAAPQPSAASASTTREACFAQANAGVKQLSRANMTLYNETAGVMTSVLNTCLGDAMPDIAPMQALLVAEGK